eukprot:3224496-Prymnesium_polylepis.1
MLTRSGGMPGPPPAAPAAPALPPLPTILIDNNAIIDHSSYGYIPSRLNPADMLTRLHTPAARAPLSP